MAAAPPSGRRIDLLLKTTKKSLKFKVYTGQLKN
jgi:hypothetical protein